MSDSTKRRTLSFAFLMLSLFGVGAVQASEHWTKYSNNEFGFALEYPSHWKVRDDLYSDLPMESVLKVISFKKEPIEPWVFNVAVIPDSAPMQYALGDLVKLGPANIPAYFGAIPEGNQYVVFTNKGYRIEIEERMYRKTLKEFHGKFMKSASTFRLLNDVGPEEAPIGKK